jgi:hypothetical protein
MKRLFKSNETERIPRKAASIEKSAQIESRLEIKNETFEQERPKIQASITDKTWILIMNGNKKVTENKINNASCEGFSEKLRPNIWHWLSVRN